MSSNKIFIALKKIVLFIVTFSLINCTSRSAQAKTEREKDRGNSSSNINNEKAKHLAFLNNNLQFLPTSTTGQIIEHNYFTASYSEKDEQSEWVAYKISSENFNDHIKRTNDYREDPFVKTKSAVPNDYSRSGYDMGHMAPAHIMSHNLIAMSESFYLSNISPQKATFNRGIWKTLEGKVSYWSTFSDSIYVVTGPILVEPIDYIGANNVSVPKAFYKTLLSFKDNKIKAIAFIIPNEKSDKSIYSYAVSIDRVEEITGIDFYCKLDKTIQNKVEANNDLKRWILMK